ncbi:MAG: phytanoyl-CoA dioxygenase family protein [Candidatus Poribacteria bacterium]|nr:phytanoyl-CoA dioxygenase family protein [Candidatus Poribacteria bacterium]
MGTAYLTAEQRKHWNEEGYLIVKQVVSPEEIHTILKAVDTVVEGYVQEEYGPDTPRFGRGAFTIIRAIERTDALDILTDHPKIFGTILSLMGPYLQIMGTQIYVRHFSDTQLIAFHTDAGPSLQQIHPHPQSLPLQFKVQFFLTDLSQPDSGNFMLVPGSHRKPFPADSPEKDFVPEGAIQVLAEAGDAVIFPWAAWHAVGPNKTNRIRKSVTFRYGQMWSRPYDYQKLPPDVSARMTPRRRRLFGDMGEDYHPTDYFKPNDQLEIILGNEWGHVFKQ